MAAFVQHDITVGGINMMAKGQAGKKIRFAYIALGDGFLLQAQDPHAMTSLVSEVMQLDVSGVSIIGNGVVEVRAPFTNADMKKGFSYREIGLFAVDPDTGLNILYCYGNAGDLAEWIPPSGGASAIEKIVKVITIIGAATNVAAQLKSGIYITTEELSDSIEKHNKIANSHPDIRDALSSLNEKLENTPQIKVFPLLIPISAWITVDGGGYYCDVNNEVLQEVQHVEINFDKDSLDATAICGLSSTFELSSGNLRFRSVNVPNTDLTGEYIITAESGGVLVTGTSTIEKITVSEKEQNELLEILKI